jgi:uncharacterized coiled-coil protein SlyX
MLTKRSKPKPVSAAVALEVRVAQLESAVAALTSQLVAAQDHVQRVDNAAGQYVVRLENSITELQAGRSKKKALK